MGGWRVGGRRTTRSAVALVSAYDARTAESTRRRFGEKGFEEPEFYEFRPAEGAEIVG